MKYKTTLETLFLLSLAIFNILLRVFRIDQPPVSFLNEKYYILPAVRDILSGLGDTKPITPPSPLGKLFFAYSIKILGDNPFGWRILPAVFTSVSAVLVYFLAKSIFKNKWLAAVASLLFTFETATFVHSRSADPEAIVVTFVLLALIFAWKAIAHPRPLAYILCGIFFGLAVIIKPQAFLMLFSSLLSIMLFAKTNLLKKITSTSTISLIAMAIYVVGFAAILKIENFQSFLKLHKDATNYHTRYWPQNYYRAFEKSEYAKRLPEFNEFILYPATWLKDPKIPYFEMDIDGKKQVVLFIFNPAIFYPAIATFIIGTILAFKSKDSRLTFLLFTASSAYFPYLASSFYKPLTYPPYYLLFGLPSLIILLSYFLDIVRKRIKLVFIIYLLVAIAVFVLYYPLLVAISTEYFYFNLLTGLR